MQIAPQIETSQPTPQTAAETGLYCPACGGVPRHLLRRASHASCSDRFGAPPPLGWGQTIHYWQCSGCAHIFTRDFDHWTQQDFARRIYNASYVAFDPAYPQRRPEMIARAVLDTMPLSTKILDFGSGSGVLTRILNDAGMAVCQFDPMQGHDILDHGQFELVLAIEVVEHCPFPGETFGLIHGALEPGGAVIASTLLVPEALEHNAWWLGPRNGHVCAFSGQSLARFLPGVRSITRGVHLYGGQSHDQFALERLCHSIDDAVLCER